MVDRSKPTVGLVIVHGIGDPAPGEVLRDLTDSLEAAKLATFDASMQEERLVDTVRSSNRRLVFFPAHLRTGRTQPQEYDAAAAQQIVAAEVFWGSASQLAPGKWGVLQGVASLLLNVPALVVGADDHRQGIPGLLHRMAWLTSMLLAGPVLAFNVLLMLGLAVYLAAYAAIGHITASWGRWELVIPAIAVAMAAGLSWHNWLWFKEAQWALRLSGPICIGGMFWTGVSMQGFAEAAVWALWLNVVCVAALLLFLGTYFCFAAAAKALTQSCVTMMLVVCLQFGFWALVVPLTWRVLNQVIPDDAILPWMKALFAGGARSDGLQWMLAAFVLAAAGLVAVERWLYARAEEKRVETNQVSSMSAEPAPRMIVNATIARALFAMTMLGAAVLLATALWPARVPDRVVMLVQWGAALNMGGMVAVLLPLGAKQLRVGLDLAHDVIYYIYYCCECGRRLMNRAREGAPTTVNPMRSRFSAVVNYLIKEFRITHLVVVAHSQGSIIAVDEFTHAWPEGELPPVSLVTCGSPVTELYQHYFPVVYPSWDHGQWNRLFARVRRWGNFYRLDDYVGTRITPAAGLCDFYQRAVGRGGHTSYWRDPRFIAALNEWGLFQLPDAFSLPAVEISRSRATLATMPLRPITPMRFGKT